MTSQQRLLAAIRCGEPDRVPLNLMGVPAWDEEWVAAQDESYRPVIQLTLEHGDFFPNWYPQYGLLLTASEDFRRTSETTETDERLEVRERWDTPAGPLFCAHTHDKRGQVGMRTEYPVKTLDNLDRALSVPYVPEQPDCMRHFDMQRRLGDRGVVYVCMSDAIHFLQMPTGSETLALWSVLHRERVLEAVEVFTRRVEDLVSYLLGQGMGPVFGWIGAELAVPPLLSPADFREFVTPFDARPHRLVYQAGGLVHCHCHSKVGSVLEEFAAMGANCLNPLEAPPMGDVTLAEAKRRIGDRVCLEGNVQFGDMLRAPEREIARQVRECLEIAAPGGGFILTQTSIPHMKVMEEQTVRNYVTFIETAVRWGR